MGASPVIALTAASCSPTLQGELVNLNLRGIALASHPEASFTSRKKDVLVERPFQHLLESR